MLIKLKFQLHKWIYSYFINLYNLITIYYSNLSIYDHHYFLFTVNLKTIALFVIISNLIPFYVFGILSIFFPHKYAWKFSNFSNIILSLFDGSFFLLYS